MYTLAERNRGYFLGCLLDSNLQNLTYMRVSKDDRNDTLDQQSYAATEIEARAVKLGLCRHADLVLPWGFRRDGEKSGAS